MSISPSCDEDLPARFERGYPPRSGEPLGRSRDCKDSTFERMFRVYIELLVLCNFLYNFLNNHIVIYAHIARVEFYVIVAGYRDDLYRLLRWGLLKRRKCSSTLNSLFSILSYSLIEAFTSLPSLRPIQTFRAVAP